ncbi:ABC transporter permease subunit [Derxia lacustris]|uniref:ABC transporter permease subunit n=1 Tax=Derxia lacustris TaxID=764842 RepID=UPI000A1784D1|nr:ABC transporter ATP-binding protein [Derxia lacustris]
MTSTPQALNRKPTLFPRFADNPGGAIAATLVTAVVLALLPFGVGHFGNAWVRILDFALLYVMLALGLNIVVGFAGLLDLGYIAFYAVGAYMYGLLASPHLTETFPAIAALVPGGMHVPVWFVIPLAGGLAAFFGVMLGAPTLKLRGDYLAIVTLGFGEIVRIFMLNLNAPLNLTNGPQGINLIDPIAFGDFSLGKRHEIFGTKYVGTYFYYYVFLGLTVLTIVACNRLQDSRIGRAWMAIREDEIAAKAMGINTRNIKLLAFAMGASFGGVAGSMFAAFQGFISPESFSLMESIVVLAMVVLGGMGHIPGVVFGAVLLAVFPEALRYVAGPAQDALFGRVIVDAEVLRMLIYGVAMVAIMLLRPKGLWPAPVHGVVPAKTGGAAQ